MRSAQRVKSNPDTFLESPETPGQRRARLANAQQNAAVAQSAIAENEAREDQRMRSLTQRAKNNMLSINDLMGGLGPIPLSRSDVMLPEGHQVLTEEFPTNHDDIIMEDLYRRQSGIQPEPPRRQPLQSQPQSQRQMLTENRTVSTSSRSGQKVTDTVQSENWRAKRYLGETRGGGEIQVWKVENIKTGNSLRTLFRIEGVASRIAMILNESNNLNDTRVVSLVNAYEKRDKLLKEARGLEKSGSDGKQMKSERLRVLHAEINQLDYRLGI